MMFLLRKPTEKVPWELIRKNYYREYGRKRREKPYTFGLSCINCQREFLSSSSKRGTTISAFLKHYSSCTSQETPEERKNRVYENNRKSRIKRTDLINQIKEERGCYVCHERCAAVLDFHHKDPKEKEHGISRIVRCSIARLMVEIDKCVVLCSNCHRKFHAELLSLID